MGVLIDASVLIDYERGRVDVEGRIRGREEETFFLSVVTASELLHGVHRAKDPVTRARRTAFVEGVSRPRPPVGDGERPGVQASARPGGRGLVRPAFELSSDVATDSRRLHRQT